RHHQFPRRRGAGPVRSLRRRGRPKRYPSELALIYRCHERGKRKPLTMFHHVKRSISRKLVLGVLGTTLTTLLVAGSTMLVLDIRNYQTSWTDDLRAQADILAQVTTPALEFNDSKTAGEDLRQLRARPLIVDAAVYRPDGTLFATYARKIGRASCR